jgi:nitric oxide reductase large subunit
MKNNEGSNLQIYREERRGLVEALLDQSRSFDKFLLTLAAGAFGLSFLFIQQFAPIETAEAKGFLIAAWILFAGSILLTMLSFLFSQAACLKQMKILGDWYQNGCKDEPKNLFTTGTIWLNWVSMGVFILGVGAFIVFAIQNI